MNIEEHDADDETDSNPLTTTAAEAMGATERHRTDRAWEDTPNIDCPACRGRLVAAGLPGLYECVECGRVHHQIAGEIEDAESATNERSAVGAWGGRR